MERVRIYNDKKDNKIANFKSRLERFSLSELKEISNKGTFGYEFFLNLNDVPALADYTGTAIIVFPMDELDLTRDLFIVDYAAEVPNEPKSSRHLS